MRISGLVCGAVMAAVALLAATDVAHARSEYNTEFWKLYDKELGSQKDATKCNACHYGAEKKNRNDFGKAVGTALGETKVKDAAKIKTAIEKAAKEKSATEGKTFGDLIKEGKLPGKAPN